MAKQVMLLDIQQFLIMVVGYLKVQEVATHVVTLVEVLASVINGRE